MAWELVMPKQILTGAGSYQKIGNVIKQLGGKKALIITDKGIVKAGLVDEINRYVGVPIAIYDGTEPEPPEECVVEGLTLLKEEKCDIVIGLGGGSPIDVAKAVAIMDNNVGSITNYEGFNKIPNSRRIPLILVNTTAGTGSEISKFAMIINKEQKRKLGIGSYYLSADAAIDDYKLTISVPPSITATTGFDALTHAIGAYTRPHVTPFVEATALKAIELVSKYLRRAKANGEDLEARSGMMDAQLLAGMAMVSVGLGADHALCQALGVVVNVSHGAAAAVFLPHVMKFNLFTNPTKFTKIAKAMGEHVKGLSLRDAAFKSIAAVEKLIQDLGLPNLKKIGFEKEDIPILVSKAMQDPCTLLNPRKVNEQDYVNICKEAIGDNYS